MLLLFVVDIYHGTTNSTLDEWRGFFVTWSLVYTHIGGIGDDESASDDNLQKVTLNLTMIGHYPKVGLFIGGKPHIYDCRIGEYLS